MECACIDADVSDFCEVLFEKVIIAKIEHQCVECGRKIPIGESHLFEKTVYEGKFSNYRTCSDCHSVREHLVCSFYYGHIWELVHESLWEYGDNQPWDRIGRLTPTARNAVCEMIERFWRE